MSNCVANPRFAGSFSHLIFLAWALEQTSNNVANQGIEGSFSYFNIS